MNAAILRSFLDDIKSHADDDTPRLIFADWLDDNAETDADRARAQLLRGSGDAGTLLERHKADWLGPMAVGMGYYQHRGLLQVYGSTTGLLSRRMSRFAESPAWDWVEGLLLTGGDQRLPRIWSRPWLATISRLELRCHRRALPGLYESPHLGAVRNLDLAVRMLENPAAVTPLAFWPGLAQVEKLNLTSNQLGPIGVANLAGSPHLGSLRRLQLGRCEVGDAGAQALLRCPRLARIESLQLGRNNLTGAALVGFGDASFTGSLRSLDLGNNQLGGAGLGTLATLRLPSLRELFLSNGWFDDAAGRSLVAAPWLPDLEFLDLSDNPLRAIGPNLLATAWPRLQTLRLIHCRLGRDAGEALGRSPWLRSLRTLNCYKNAGFGDAFVAGLTTGDSMPALADLTLAQTDLSDHSALAVARWPGLNRLRSLHLGDNLLTDVGLRALVESPLLAPTVQLRLSGNQPSRGLVREFARRTPAIRL